MRSVVSVLLCALVLSACGDVAKPAAKSEPERRVAVKLKLAIELDGATHSTSEERQSGERRTASLEQRGWTVLRFWNAEVYDNPDGVLASIEARLPPRA